MARPSRTGGKTSEAKARNAGPAKGRKTTKTKRRIDPAATRVKRRSIPGPSEDLTEAREQQAATAEILKVIASSPSDAQPVFEAIAASANRLIGGFSAGVFRLVDGIVHLASYTPVNPAADEALKASFPRSVAELPYFDLAKNGEVSQEADTENSPDDRLKNLARARGFRSRLLAPLMSNKTQIGVIAVTRKNPGPFAAHHVELLQTFADQAVIAIENVRLFNETQQSLARQAATTEILEVVNSSPGNLTPVFDAILEKATLLSNSAFGALAIHNGDDMHQIVAMRGMPAEFPDFLRGPVRLGPETGLGRLVRGESVVHIIDAADDEAYRLGNPVRRALVDIAGARSYLAVPIAKDGILLGSFTIYRREVRPFEADVIALLQNFATQAAIAVQNARLFNETQEALERQTATADILKVIASSPSDVQPVFDAIATSAKRLIGAFSAVVFRFVDSVAHVAAFTSTNPTADELLRASFPRPVAEFPPFERAHAGGVVQVPDTEAEPDARMKQLARARGFRSVLNAPLMSKETPLGLITVTRKDPGSFADHHVQLLQTFADQAVIAIENVRLFDEVQARTRDLTEALTYQTGSSNILSVIASSPTDVAPVLKAIVESACELCEAYDAIIALKDGNELALRAHHGPIAMNRERWPNHRTSLSGRAIADGVPVHLRDVLSDEGVEFPIGQEMSRLDGVRSMLSVPMIRDGDAIGTIVLRRIEVNPFSDKQVALLQTFADQAVIAIGNVRTFEQVQERTRELSQSLDDLRTAQDRLVQTEKLASLGQLTAGIAHEIKNPLNFVNNFSALSAELTDELNDVLKPVAMDGKVREEVDELTGLLKDNLEKVVQHGKRADSIVKNMLLHSREGSGEHHLADINAIVDESLNLAYHGARAEKPNFNVTIQRCFDPTVGTADVYPQEITRVLLNLISNGFYATAKTEADDGYEPTVTATTKDLDDEIEIRIRDNGTGIPDEVKAKIFNPFFTTKPAGEGTGLGLSMSHDIIVKQHGGRIDVETEPGQFTEFRIVLPRTNNFTK
jgi:GAF domain-containing protein